MHYVNKGKRIAVSKNHRPNGYASVCAGRGAPILYLESDRVFILCKQKNRGFLRKQQLFAAKGLFAAVIVVLMFVANGSGRLQLSF